MDKVVESLGKEYIREFLRPGGSDEEKLVQLDEWIERICPIRLPEQFQKDEFYKNLLGKIHAEENRRRKEMLVKAAVAAVAVGIGGNGVCEAATGNSILHYIKEAGQQVQEFRIEIQDRINPADKEIEEGNVTQYQEKEASSWREIEEKCSWDLRYPKEEGSGITRSQLYAITDEGKVVSVTAEYEKENGIYYIFTVDHYENEQGTADYSIPDDAEEIKTERIAKMKVVYYQTEEEIIAIGTGEKEVYEITSNDDFEMVRKFVISMEK